MGKRIIARRRGRGGNYRAPSHRYKAQVVYPSFEAKGEVMDLVHDPGHSAPLAKIGFSIGEGVDIVYLFAVEGEQVGQEIEIGRYAPVEPGNVLPLSRIPEGAYINNIESQPGDGGKFVRTAGTAAVVVSQGTQTMVQMPSGRFKSFQPKCRAMIGVIAGGGRQEKPIAKAGKAFYKYQSKARYYPRVKGVAMNPVDHPHGGGNHPHVGRASTVSANAPPGRKVGRLSRKKKRTKKKKKRKK
jgi:large subunit ribosomal protein L2